jgi:putative phage head-tail adaptor
MTFNYEIILLKRVIELNELNEEEVKFIETKILANIESISMREFYESKNSDLQADITFIIHEFEYSGQHNLKYENKKFEIIRSYKRKDGLLELTCKEVILNE